MTPDDHAAHLAALREPFRDDLPAVVASIRTLVARHWSASDPEPPDDGGGHISSRSRSPTDGVGRMRGQIHTWDDGEPAIGAWVRSRPYGSKPAFVGRIVRYSGDGVIIQDVSDRTLWLRTRDEIEPALPVEETRP